MKPIHLIQKDLSNYCNTKWVKQSQEVTALENLSTTTNIQLAFLDLGNTWIKSMEITCQAPSRIGNGAINQGT
jgi:hypothetical protein